MIGCDYRLGRRAESPNYCVIWADTPVATTADKQSPAAVSSRTSTHSLCVCFIYTPTILGEIDVGLHNYGSLFLIRNSRACVSYLWQLYDRYE